MSTSGIPMSRIISIANRIHSLPSSIGKEFCARVLPATSLVAEASGIDHENTLEEYNLWVEATFDIVEKCLSRLEKK